MSHMEFKTSYKRPIQLSDPYEDFTPRILKKLLAKSDEELDWLDYSLLFGPHLPAGTYEEVMYFLPQAFSCLETHEDDALDLVISIFGFCSKNTDNLKRDGLLNIVKSRIMDCLNYWSRNFRIMYFDKNACLKKGWGLDHCDVVINAEVIAEGTTQLVRFETLQDIAEKFTDSLAYHKGDVVKASWFLEYSRSRFDVYTPPNTDKIDELLSNKELLNSAYATVLTEALEQQISPTYWRDTLNQLNI